ncbi:MAG: hypothetical protein IT371_05365 [Deltaproteobacteria bacterium]|nr:hypothetical protein [Deltaproteobacteria bacterium]
MSHHRCDCRQPFLAYSEAFDAYFCPACRSWAEPLCAAPECCYCPTRPPTAHGLLIDDMVPKRLFSGPQRRLSGHPAGVRPSA